MDTTERKVVFFLLDINTVMGDGKPEVRLWGLDEDGKCVIVLDRSLLPYFYVVPDDGVEVEQLYEQLKSLQKSLAEITETAFERRRFLGKEIDVVRVTCTNPESLTEVAGKLSKVKGVRECLEADIRFSTRYIIDRKINPCSWHEAFGESRKLADAVKVRVFEARRPPKALDVRTVPKFRILSFNIVSIGERGTPRAERDPIAIIAVATNDGRSEAFTRLGPGDKTVIEDFVKHLKDFSPDIVVGFGNNQFDWPYLLERAKKTGVRLAVDRIGGGPHTSVFGHISITGRANLDLSDFAAEIPELKLKNLENLAKFVKATPLSFKTLDETEIPRLWENKESRGKLIAYMKENAERMLEVAERILDFPMELAALTGLPLDQVLTAATGFRVDSFILRKAHEIGELAPRRVEQTYVPYRGAIVLAPQVGLHEDVAVLDFSAMYPNLMIIYNISPETLLVGRSRQGDEASVVTVPEVGHRFLREPKGFFPMILSELTGEREKIKRELSSLKPQDETYRLLAQRERAVKLITNACYGYAGWIGARWYVREVAESTAALGRATIKRVIEMAQKLGLNVIYGDTDSIFIQRDNEKIRQLTEWATEEVKIDIKPDRIYERVLFTEAKKRYAGITREGTVEIVGLEVVRGDWPVVAKDLQEQVIELILRRKPLEEAVEYVRESVRRLQRGEVPLSQLVIWKTLTKPLEKYEVRAPHVEAARRLLKEGWQISLGDKVGFVITKGKGKLFEKARPYQFASLDQVDKDYYVENMLLPAALRVLGIFGVAKEKIIGDGAR